MTRIILLTALVWATSGCGPGWVLGRVGPAAAPEPRSGSTPDRLEEPAQIELNRTPESTPDPLTRCGRVCLHIAELSAPESDRSDRQDWLQACRVSCETGASKGRLDCYERSTNEADLTFCMEP